MKVGYLVIREEIPVVMAEVQREDWSNSQTQMLPPLFHRCPGLPPPVAVRPAERQIVWIGGWQFRKVSVRGQVSVNKHRKEEIRLVIRRRFSGELVSAEGDPQKILREEGIYVNPRRELVWNLTLKPGEGKTFAYRYTALARH